VSQFEEIPRRRPWGRPEGQANNGTAIAFLQFRVDAVGYPPGEDDPDLRLWYELQERESSLLKEIDASAKEFFGPQASAVMTFSTGSLVIEVFLIGYAGLKLYREVIGNLDWFRAHIEGIIRRFFGPLPVSVVGQATPSPRLQADDESSEIRFGEGLLGSISY
jgi:hypothetical protein